MGALTDETNTLKLYTSMDGEIWYVAGSGIPKPSSYSYGELCEELRLVNKKSVVRLVGSSNNARLITTLYLHMLDGDISGLQVCSPQVEFVNLDEYSPEKVLMNMRKWKYPSSLGGFHDVEVEDYTIYSMAYLLSSTKPSKKSTEQLMALFKKHPMSKIFSFVPFFNQEMCAKLLAVTLDPRWYVDLSNPDKLYKYYNWMGVGGLKSSGEDQPLPEYSFAKTRADRRQLVLGCWQNNLTNDVNWKDNFLAVTYGKVKALLKDSGLKKETGDFDEADLATSQKFLSFVFGSWLNLMYPMPNNWMEPLFSPELFLSSETEVERYKAYMSKPG